MQNLSCDFFVCGGGIAGICAAISASRHGLKVVLINDRSVLGGNASSELGVTIEGADHHGLNPSVYAKENGIIEEIRLRMAELYSGGGYGKAALMDAVLLDMILAEDNLTLMQNTLVYDCYCAGDKIESVCARNVLSNAEYTVFASCFADCTGNGILGERAGALYMTGRESKSDYGEKWAPDTADSFTMGNTLSFETENVGHKVEFKAPDFAYDISGFDFVKGIDNKENFRKFRVDKDDWTYEFGGQLDTISDCEEIDIELRRLTFGIWDYIKNSGKYPEADNYVLKRVFAKSGMRESRRFVGEYVLTENDIENKVNFEDSVCVGGWPMDVHAKLGIFDTEPASNFIPVTGLYNIPFRSLYSANIKNLMFAGRNVSITHIALGSVRVMGTCGCMGQAIGTAAFLLNKYGIFPHELQQKHMTELCHMLIENDQTILHRKRHTDNHFTVQGGTELKYENTSGETQYIPLERDYGIMLMTDTDTVERLSVMLKCTSATTLSYYVMTGSHRETFLPDTVLKRCNVSLEAGFCGFKEIDINANPGTDSKIYIVFSENNDVLLGVSEQHVPGAVTIRMHRPDNCAGMNHDSIPLDEKTGYTHYDFVYEKNRNIKFCDIIPRQHIFSADNVLDGYTRPYGVMNMWKSEKSSDDYLLLNAEEAVDVKNIEIIFDNELDVKSGYIVPGTLTKDYDIIFHTSHGDYTISVNDNFQRVRRHSVNQDDVFAIEIRLNRSHGKKFGIYYIKVDY